MGHPRTPNGTFLWTVSGGDQIESLVITIFLSTSRTCAHLYRSHRGTCTVQGAGPSALTVTLCARFISMYKYILYGTFSTLIDVAVCTPFVAHLSTSETRCPLSLSQLRFCDDAVSCAHYSIRAVYPLPTATLRDRYLSSAVCICGLPATCCIKPE